MKVINLVTLDKNEIETLKKAKGLLGDYIDFSNKENGYMPLRINAYNAYNTLLIFLQNLDHCSFKKE